MNKNIDEDATAAFIEALRKPAWDAWLFKDTERRAKLLQLNPKFQSQVEAMRYKFGINPTLYQTKAAAESWAKSLEAWQTEWDECVNYIMIHANLMSGWRRGINTYVLTDKFHAPPAVLIHDTLDRHGHPSLQLAVNDQVSKKDFDKLIKHVNSWVESYGHQSRTKRMPYKRLDYYLEMYELRQSGLSNKEISRELGTKYEAQEDAPTFTTKYVREKLSGLDSLIDNQFS